MNSSPTVAPGAICQNCGAEQVGGWCHHCGQNHHHTHRSIWHLVGETLETITHADSRLWRTLYRLAFFPGKLTLDYINGKRASQIPPIRLFVVSALVFFLATGNIFKVNLDPTAFDNKGISAQDQKDFDDLKSLKGLNSPGLKLPPAIKDWMKEQLPIAIQHPDALGAAMGQWAHHLAFLMLPISAFLLYLLFFWRRSITLFDHVIFAAHSLSFQGFFVSLVALSSAILHEGTIHTLLLISPLHLYKHMRVAYGCSRIATLTRMGLLFAGTVLGFSFLLLLLLILGLNDLHG